MVIVEEVSADFLLICPPIMISTQNRTIPNSNSALVNSSPNWKTRNLCLFFLSKQQIQPHLIYLTDKQIRTNPREQTTKIQTQKSFQAFEGDEQDE